jgi:phosphoglycolate phosphatase-like HAD superfamily hydrolase
MGIRCAVSLAILDIDGTLVDTNYHHAIAWFRAFAEHGLILPIWRIHRHLGMGGDQLVEAVTDERTETELGDRIRETEKQRYTELIKEVRPMEGDHYLDLLDARELADAWTSSADVEETKPQPDLVHAALQRGRSEPRDATMIGDTPWDVQAAERAGVATIGVLSGGFSIEELTETGAVSVWESIDDLRHGLDRTPLA